MTFGLDSALGTTSHTAVKTGHQQGQAPQLVDRLLAALRGRGVGGQLQHEVSGIMHEVSGLKGPRGHGLQAWHPSPQGVVGEDRTSCPPPSIETPRRASPLTTRDRYVAFIHDPTTALFDLFDGKRPAIGPDEFTGVKAVIVEDEFIGAFA